MPTTPLVLWFDAARNDFINNVGAVVDLREQRGLHLGGIVNEKLLSVQRRFVLPRLLHRFA